MNMVAMQRVGAVRSYSSDFARRSFSHLVDSCEGDWRTWIACGHKDSDRSLKRGARDLSLKCGNTAEASEQLPTTRSERLIQKYWNTANGFASGPQFDPCHAHGSKRNYPAQAFPLPAYRSPAPLCTGGVAPSTACVCAIFGAEEAGPFVRFASASAYGYVCRGQGSASLGPAKGGSIFPPETLVAVAAISQHAGPGLFRTSQPALEGESSSSCASRPI
jgi:hypothetical protein